MDILNDLLHSNKVDEQSVKGAFNNLEKQQKKKKEVDKINKPTNSSIALAVWL